MQYLLIMKFIIYTIGLVILLFSYSGFCQSVNQDTSKTILLILGSGNLNGSIARAEIGSNFYNSKKNIDYIIVSGGCGAHSSSICEATIMSDVLIEKGIPENIIIKEEKSRSTAQNYCYSRDLLDSEGKKLVNKGDNLFVVSNHWHAMSVSGCFNDKDLANSNYVIEGSIIPKPSDQTDYGAIYNNCINNPNYCNSVLWPKIDAAYSMERLGETNTQNRSNLFIKDIVVESETSHAVYATISERLVDLPQYWTSNIDASFYNRLENLIYLFKDRDYIAITPGTSKIEKGYPKATADLFSNLSDHWRNGSLDAAFFNPNTRQIYFFKGDKYVRLDYKKNKSQRIENPKLISTLVKEWPFKWSVGDIDAAVFLETTNEVRLFRGQEALNLKFEGEYLIILDKEPQKIKLDWPTEYWGTRN